MHNILIAAGTGLAAAVAGVTFGFGGSDEPAKAPDRPSQIHKDPVSGGWEPGDRLGPPPKKFVDNRTGGRDLDAGA